MIDKQYLALLASSFISLPGGLLADSIILSSTIPATSIIESPHQITFSIFESQNADQVISSQTFYAGEWKSSRNQNNVNYEVQFNNLETDTYKDLWFETTIDGVVLTDRQPIRGAVSDMYIAGQIETGIGVRFPGGGLQIAPGITSESDPGLPAHTGNSSAHHASFTNQDAVDAVLANDGSGSLLDADFLDGQSIENFAVNNHSHDAAYVNISGDTMTGSLTTTNGTFQDIVSILDDNDNETIRLEGDETGGGSSSVLEMSLSDGTRIFDLDTSLNEIRINNDAGLRTVLMDGDSGQGGLVRLYNQNGSTTLTLDGDDGDAGSIVIEDSTSLITMVIEGEEAAGGGSQILMYNKNAKQTVQIDADSSTEGGYLRIYDALGNASITLDGDIAGDGRITTQELSITGGSDLSEQFDINSATVSVKPGMLVSIDPFNPGKLIPSKEAYDRKVAGIISGAGGIKPGMMMGQEGSIANGEFPVALTGRVYAMVNADNGAIQPGDLLTTSDIPGYAMKVIDHQRAAGAVIGKAMTPLDKGQGLVLVLVSLQ